MKKRIRLTVEWEGQCGEPDWAHELSREIERCDRSRTTRVVKVEHLTGAGRTDPHRATLRQRWHRWWSTQWHPPQRIRR